MAFSVILDHRGRPIESKRPIVGEEYAGIGGGRDITRGYVSESLYLWPQDKVLRYQGGNAGSYELYEDLLQDDRVYATFSQRRSAVVAREWAVEPGGTMRRDKMAADFLREQLEHVRWNTVSNGMLYGVFYGFSVAECMWARDGRRVTLDKIKVRNRRRFVFDPDFRVLLLTNDNTNGEAMPIRKFWHFSSGADNDDEPYGRGLAYWLYWPWWFKRNHVRFWLLFLEKFGMPTGVGKYPKSAGPRERAVLLEAVRAIHSDSAVTVPEDMMIELLEASRAGSVDYDAFYQRMDDAIATVVLSQTMTTSDGGSMAQAKVHMEVRKEVVEADAHLVDDSFQRGPATWLTEWNFPRGTAVPIVRRIMDNPADQKALAERDKIIVGMGHKLTVEYVEDTYQVEVDRTVPDPPVPPAPAPGMPGQNGPGVELAEDEEDSVDVLREQAGRTIGPLIDRWVDTAREQLENADSLGGFRERLDTMEIDVGPVAQALGRAMLAAALAGRLDVDAPIEVEFAEFASFEHVRLPFGQQISFFRGKLNLPTETWTDLWQSQHDKGFVVAGAARDDLLADLRTAVDSAIAEGTALRTFQSRFDQIVAKHGWSYKGGRNWRTRVIYDTNLRTSYAAGRWQQLQAVKAQRPYWRYRHSAASEHPREKHLQWDGLVLSADDPWWRTHYPPNGWGCKCYVEALSQRDIERLGLSGPDTAPPIEMRTVTVERDGSPVILAHPLGVDPGFGYAPGESVG